MNTQKTFLLIFVVATLIYETIPLLVPKGLSPNIIEDLESNYHSIKNLYQQAIQLKDLLPKEDFSSISRFLDDFKDYFDDYKHQENRSILSLQKIDIQFENMEAILDPTDDPILDEGLLKKQPEILQELVKELEDKIKGIKADRMMLKKEKADDLYRRIQLLKEKFSVVRDSIEDLYAAKELKETKVRQLNQLNHQRIEFERKIQELNDAKMSKNISLRTTEGRIRDSNQRHEEIQKQIEELDKPKPSMNSSTSKKAFHYIFLVDISRREDEKKNNLEEVYLNIEALKASRKSERDIFSLIAFDKEVQVLAERLPIAMKARLDLRSIDSQSRLFKFEKGLEKASQFVKNSRNKEETPVVILYTDGMRWYYEAKPAQLDPKLRKEEGGFWDFFWRIWNWIVNWFRDDKAEPAPIDPKSKKEEGGFWDGIVSWFRRSFCKEWVLKPMKESEINEMKKQLADFSARFSDCNLTSFVSGTTSQNQDILRDFAKALNKNEIMLQTTIGENYEYFNLARTTTVFPQIFKALSVAGKGPVSAADLVRKRIQKETEEMKKKIFGEDDGQNFDKKSLLKEKDDLEKKLNGSLWEKDKIESEIKTFEVEIGKLQSERNVTDSKILGLNEEIELANQKILEKERMKKEREKLEVKYAVIRSHLDILEQLAKAIQARDHNILAIFEHVVTYCKDFLTSFKRVLQNSEASDYDLLIEFYKDRLKLYGNDVENMEKIGQMWLGKSYDQVMTRNFFMMISPREVVENDLELRKVEQAVESLQSGRRNLDEYLDFYMNLRRKISVFKNDQKMQRMNSQRSEIRSLFSKEIKELMKKLEGKKYIMYWL